MATALNIIKYKENNKEGDFIWGTVLKSVKLFQSDIIRSNKYIIGYIFISSPKYKLYFNKYNDRSYLDMTE